MFNPLISIVVPCYNVEEFVARAVESILKQSYTNLEVFLIDDASTDGTFNIINSFKDDRVRIITYGQNTQKIGGVNEVLADVKGEYIAFQDADDWSETDRIEKQLSEFSKDKNLGICFTNFRNISSSITTPLNIARTNEELRDEFLHFRRKKLANGLIPPVCASMMITKDVLKKTKGYHPFFKGRVAEDIHWIYRILKEYKGITVNETLYNYQVRRGSMTNDQQLGVNAKYSYSWQLLQKIIEKDIEEGIDVLGNKNEDSLHLIELESCEEALLENVKEVSGTKLLYESSTTFKIGKFILSPFRYFKRVVRNLKRCHYEY